MKNRAKIQFILPIIILVFGVASYFLLKPAILEEKIKLLSNQKNIYGFEVNSNLFKSDYLIINFWASWCPPCVAETPSLIQFTKDHPEFKLIAISQDDTSADILNFTKLFPNFKNHEIEVVFDQSKSLGRKFNVEKLPETFIYSFKTNKYLQISGSTMWEDPELLKYIYQQLK